MKKLIKIAANFMAIAVMTVAAFGFSACEDLETVELSLSIYNNANATFYEEDDVKFTVDLYRHLAPKTCDAILERIESGYYSDAIFYQEDGKIMLGEYKFENGELVQNTIDGKLPAEIYGEFEYNGTYGSNLLTEKGSVVLWRSYYATDYSYKTSDNARDSGRATWYIPTSATVEYDGYFCVFAQYNTEDEANLKAIAALEEIFSNGSYYTEYVVYYTGVYDTDKADENYGLTFNAVKKADFDEDTEVFEAKGQQLTSFNKKTIRVPNSVSDGITAKVKTVTVK